MEKIELVKPPNPEAYEGNATVRIVSVFRSFAAKWPLSGRNAVFVRLQGCDLACSTCPNPEAVKHDFAHLSVGLPSEYVAETIASAFPNFGLLVFTGGEPTMQEEGIREIVDALSSNGRVFDTVLETNGRKTVSNFYDVVIISPKLSHDGNRPYPILCEGPKAHYHFVLRGEGDFAEAETILGALRFRPSPEKVWFRNSAPEGTESVVLEILRKWYSLEA